MVQGSSGHVGWQGCGKHTTGDITWTTYVHPNHTRPPLLSFTIHTRIPMATANKIMCKY